MHLASRDQRLELRAAHASRVAASPSVRTPTPGPDATHVGPSAGGQRLSPIIVAKQRFLENLLAGTRHEWL